MHLETAHLRLFLQDSAHETQPFEAGAAHPIAPDKRVRDPAERADGNARRPPDQARAAAVVEEDGVVAHLRNRFVAAFAEIVHRAERGALPAGGRHGDEALAERRIDLEAGRLIPRVVEPLMPAEASPEGLDGRGPHRSPSALRVSAITALKRRTTAGKPSSTLCPMMKCPMLTSTTSGIAAMGPRLS